MTSPVDLDALEKIASGPLECSLYVPTEAARQYHLAVLRAIGEIRALRLERARLREAIQKVKTADDNQDVYGEMPEEFWRALREMYYAALGEGGEHG